MNPYASHNCRVKVPGFVPAPQAAPDYRHPSGLTNADLLRLVNSFDKLDTFAVNGTDGFRRVSLEAARSRRAPSDPTIDPPVTGARVWHAESIQRALTEHQLGQFQNSAYLCEALVSDARVSHAINARTKGVLKRKPYFSAPKRAKNQKLAKRIADQMTELYCDLAPLEFQETLWMRTPLMGFSLYNTPWSEGPEGLILPEFRHWHESYSFFLMSGELKDRRLQAISMGGGQTGQAQTIPIEDDDENWWHYHPFGMYRGWLRGCLLQTAIPWLVRNLSLRDWSRCSEVHGVPIRIIKVPASASEPDKARLFEEAGNLGSEAVFVLPVAADGSGFDVSLLEPKNPKSWEVFSELGKRCDSDIEISIVGTQLLGALGDQGSSGKSSSMAASNTVQSENDDYSEQDAMHFCEAFRRGPIARIVRYNYGPEAADCVPMFSLSDEPPADKAATAKAWSDLSGALVSLKAVGAEIDLEAVREEFGNLITGKEVAPVVQQTNDPSNPAGDGDPRSGNPSKRPGGSVKMATQGAAAVQAILFDPAMMPEDVQQAWCQAHGFKHEGLGGVCVQRAESDFDPDTMRVIRVAAGVKARIGRMAASPTRLAKAHRSHFHGQAYTDAVTREAVAASVKAMAPHLAEVQLAIATAESPEALQKALKRLARGIKHGSLEALVKNARTMTHGAGRATEKS